MSTLFMLRHYWTINTDSSTVNYQLFCVGLNVHYVCLHSVQEKVLRCRSDLLWSVPLLVRVVYLSSSSICSNTHSPTGQLLTHFPCLFPPSPFLLSDSSISILWGMENILEYVYSWQSENIHTQVWNCGMITYSEHWIFHLWNISYHCGRLCFE